MELVCARRHVTIADIEGPSHAPQVVLARYMAVALARHFTPLSDHELGLVFNRCTGGIGKALRTYRSWRDIYNDREREWKDLVETMLANAAPEHQRPDYQRCG